MQSINANMYRYMHVVNHDRGFETRPPLRPPVKGLRAPLPRDLGNETLLRGLARSCFRVWLLSLFLRDFVLLVVAVAPSTSISIMTLLAFDSHSASAEEAGQRQA
jgi:hypothetical protein